MEAVVGAIDRERDQALEVLKDLLRIPSISTDPDRKEDVERAARFLERLLRDSGMPTVEVIPTAGHPIVFAEWMERPDAPTVLVYGHYDVQPIADRSLWTTDPFDPRVEDGKIWARGATDDKGQLLTHVLAARAHLAETGSLPVNVKFLLEGEEEIGSEHLAGFVRENLEKLACDSIAISDTSIFAPGVPSICIGLRGIAYTEITLRGAAQDLHSGGFGGAVDNPAIVLARLIAGMKDEETGRVLIDGFLRRDRGGRPTRRRRGGRPSGITRSGTAR